jgi:ATP phosphoribosyltransferase
MVKTKDISELMDQLELVGATSIIVYDLKNCRV